MPYTQNTLYHVAIINVLYQKESCVCAFWCLKSAFRFPFFNRSTQPLPLLMKKKLLPLTCLSVLTTVVVSLRLALFNRGQRHGDLDNQGLVQAAAGPRDSVSCAPISHQRRHTHTTRAKQAMTPIDLTLTQTPSTPTHAQTTCSAVWAWIPMLVPGLMKRRRRNGGRKGWCSPRPRKG